MELHTLNLARIQMAFSFGFHILFPTLTIGLSTYLVFLEGLWLRTGNDDYLKLYRFWAKIFGLSFGMGVVTGVVLEYEIGTNFSSFSTATGNVIGPLMTYEVMQAFFLEATFLPIMLFGWKHVGPKVHFFSTVMVVTGTTLSAFWILSANSWMQTPAGYTIQNGTFLVIDWFDAIFTQSLPYRFAHMVMAALLTSTFVVAGVSAWQMLHGRDTRGFRLSFSMSIGLALLLAPMQVVLGDRAGEVAKDTQPMKVAAVEAIFHTQRGAPFMLFAWPDMEAAKNYYTLPVPRLDSILLAHDPEGKVHGLDEISRKNWPNVPTLFYSFRVMVYIGGFLVLMAVLGAWFRFRRRLYDRRWYLWLCVFSIPLGFIAVIAGWIVNEVGRQPWTVYHLLRTSESVSIVPHEVFATTLTLFIIVYVSMFSAYTYYISQIVRGGLEDELPPDLLKPKKG